MKPKYWWIKERRNSRLGVSSYAAMGQLSVREAKRYNASRYGYNLMHEYLSHAEYEARLDQLRAEGCRVQ